MKVIGVVIIIVVMLIFICAIQENPDAKEKATAPQYDDEVAYNLACLDAGKILRKQDHSLIKYSKILNSLQRKCKNKRNEISDIAVKCQEILHKHNVRKSLYEILCEIDEPLTEEITGLDLGKLATLYIITTAK